MKADTIKAVCLQLVEDEMSARRHAEHTRIMTRHALALFFRWASQRGTPDPRTMGRKDLCSYHAWTCKQTSAKSKKLY